MAQELYNEGRVVGFSAYEIFMRQCLLPPDPIPEEDLPTEQQWLTSMIGMGSSMVLKVPQGTQAGVQDFPLPAGSTLSAAGIVLANPFFGTCTFDSSNWAKKVTSYGALIKNTSGSGNYPTSSNVPYGDYSVDDYKDQLGEFIKITDGIVYQSGATWSNAASQPPQKDIAPNFSSSSAVVRLYISSEIQNDFYIIFTGFHDKGILYLSGSASSGTGGSTDMDNNHWENGGMLGPEVIPWSNKIIFSVPSAAYSFIDSVSRTIPKDVSLSSAIIHDYTFAYLQDHAVNSAPVIDFNSIILTDYYTNHASDFSGTPILPEVITGMFHKNAVEPSGDPVIFNEIVAWYPGISADKITSSTPATAFFPPAIYATSIVANGDASLVPLDVAAPGTVKCFPDSTQAYQYTQILPDNYAVYFNNVTNNFTFVTPNEPDPTVWGGTATLVYQTNPKVQLSVGSTQPVKLMALSKSDGTEYATTGTSATITQGPANNLNWSNLLEALADNKSVDVLGTRLRETGKELQKLNPESHGQSSIGMVNDNKVDYLGTRWIMFNPGDPDASPAWSDSVDSNNNPNSAWFGVEVDNGDYVDNTGGVYTRPRYLSLNSGETPNATIALGTNFIKFKSGGPSLPDIKLYISAVEPDPATNSIPIGSIGIGW